MTAPRPRTVAVVLLLLATYATLTALVLSGSWLVRLDSDVYRWQPQLHWPELRSLLDWWVLLGQRAVVLVLAVAWLGWRAVRERDLRPLCTLAIATLLVNVTVGLVKTVIGRLGPLQLGHEAMAPWAVSVFTDGTIFPSGHTANAVVTWGVLAMLARRHRRVGAVLAGFLAVTIGLTTIYLGTHWVSDVLAGWVAGALVLIAVAHLGPTIDRVEGLSVASLRWARGLLATVPGALRPAATTARPAPVAARTAVPAARVIVPAARPQPSMRPVVLPRSSERTPSRSRRPAADELAVVPAGRWAPTPRGRSAVSS